MANDAEVDPRLLAFIADLTPIEAESGKWPDGHEFVLSSYFTEAVPPLDLVTSVRAVVVRNGGLLVFDDDVGPHIIPGGRVEAGETPLVTLTRELREEIGCEISGEPALLGFIRVHHAGPKPQGYPYPFPDDLHLMYLVETAGDAMASTTEPLVLGPRFITMDALQALPLLPSERAFLTHPALKGSLGETM